MEDFIKNVLAVVIIGNDENEQFDGKFKAKGQKDGFKYHSEAVREIVWEFNRSGYSIGRVNFKDSLEIGFDLVNKGHILFCNCSVNDILFGYVFIPSKITDKQIETLKLFEPIFQQFQSLYVMRIDEMDKEKFTEKCYSHDFTVDEIINNKCKRK